MNKEVFSKILSLIAGKQLYMLDLINSLFSLSTELQQNVAIYNIKLILKYFQISVHDYI